MNISPSFPPPLSSTPFVSAGTDKAVACDVQVNNTSHTPHALTHLQTFRLEPRTVVSEQEPQCNVDVWTQR